MFHIIVMWTVWCSVLSLCEQCDVPYYRYVNSVMFRIITLWTVWCSYYRYVNSVMFRIITLWTVWCSILTLCEQCDVPYYHFVNSLMFQIIVMWTVWCSVLSLCEQCDIPNCRYVNSMMFHIIIMWTVWYSILSLCEITPSWPLTIFSLSWSCFLLIRKKLSKLKYLREEENWRSLSSGLWCRSIKVVGLGKLRTLSASVAQQE